MELLRPTRIKSLEAELIRVIVHTAPDVKTTDFTLPAVFPFETLYSLKQRIALHFAATATAKAWLPGHVFVAQKVAGGFRSLEFYWPFGKTLADPFERIREVDERLWDGESRKPVFPNILSGATIEATTTVEPAGGAGGGENVQNIREIHIWSLQTLAAAAGFGPVTPITEPAFHGFISLYFPLLETKDQLLTLFGPLTEAETDVLENAKQYRTAMDARLAKVEAGLHLPAVKNAAPPRLRELRMLRYRLPQIRAIDEGQLELKFYEMNPNRIMPFMRYFSRSEKTAPIVKLALTETGAQVIENPKLLDLFMADEPATENGAVIVLKAPVKNAPLGTAWSMRIYENGVAHLSIGAPRKNEPLTAGAIQAAFDTLPAFLAETPWADHAVADRRELEEISAVYDYRSPIAEKPSKTELRGRLDAFLPFFMEERLPEKSRDAFFLRYKAVSNFDERVDPVMDHITNLFLRDGAASAAAMNPDTYVGSLMMRFGMPGAEAAAALNEWIDARAEHVAQDREKALAALNMGAGIGIGVNNHPSYTFFVSNVESAQDLQRILGLLSVFAAVPTSFLGVAAGAEEASEAKEVVAVQNAAVPDAEPAIAEEGVETQFADIGGDFGTMMNFGDFQMNAFGTQEIAEAEEAPLQPIAPIARPASPETLDIPMPEVLKLGEKVEAIGKGWFLERLTAADPAFFSYKVPAAEKRFESFSVKCQKSSFRQPFVLSADQYERARALYKDDVFWVEAPLDSEDLQAVTIASKSAEQRKSAGMALLERPKTDKEYLDFAKAAGLFKEGDKPKDVKAKVNADFERRVRALERRALELGFPLKGDKSITTADPTATAEEKAAVNRLLEAQHGKPLWTVIRAGSVPSAPNYYLCVTRWCIRDNLPLIQTEYEGELMRDKTTKKAKESCPFCGGKQIKNPEKPAAGETVLHREPTGKGDAPIAQYIGYPKEVYHPDGYALPCCFTGPDSLLHPPTEKTPPPPLVPLPPTQVKIAAGEAPAPADAPPPARAPAERQADELVADELRDRPFLPTSSRGGMNKWYIPLQNVVGRIATEWYSLAKGEVGVPPPAANLLLGQNPTKFLTANKGVAGTSINSYLKVPGSAFVRYGLGGTGLLGLLAFARYATDLLSVDVSKRAIETPFEVYKRLFKLGDLKLDNYMMIRAFEQANYGTLVHEFNGPPPAPYTEGEFNDWCSNAYMINKGAQAPYARMVYHAWLRFKAYIENANQRKDLRYFETLFAAPGVCSTAGFILARILVPKSPAEPARILCPEFGIAARYQKTKPPVIFVVEDEASGAFDPLVLVDAPSEDAKQVVGAFRQSAEVFGRLDPKLREALSAFLLQFYSPLEGCGRVLPTPHPWMAERGASRVPRLQELISRLTALDLREHYLLRDRSNRLVGMVVKNVRAVEFFIPVLDDGTIEYRSPTRRGEDAIPMPELHRTESNTDLLSFLRKLSAPENFPAMKPVAILENAEVGAYVALELSCGAIIPFKPIHVFKKDPEAMKKIHKKVFEITGGVELPVKPIVDMPWEDDIALIGPRVPGVKDVRVVNEHEVVIGGKKYLYHEEEVFEIKALEEEPEEWSFEAYKGAAAPAAIQALFQEYLALPVTSEMTQTREEVLEEAYQHLRISFSVWLNSTAAGERTKAQIELLRAARVNPDRQLPLWELRKRMDLLIVPVVHKWITAEGAGDAAVSLLRRDCTQIHKRAACTGGCSWVGGAEDGRCLIHTTETERFLDPVRVLSARLVDELIRSFGAAMEVLEGRVPRLRGLGTDEVVREDGVMLFSAQGRGSEDLFRRLGYLGRKPGAYTAGLTFPEEVDLVTDEPVGVGALPGDWLDAGLRPAVFAAEVGRDKRAALEAALTEISGKPASFFAAHLGKPDFWVGFAQLIGAEVLLTGYDEVRKAADVTAWYSPPKLPVPGGAAGGAPALPKPRKFLLVDLEGIPLQQADGSFFLSESALPKSIANWLESHTPTA